jgi:LPXTG-motif cell wall-anchored protein
VKLHLILIVLLCISSAAAFTITPAKVTFDTPGIHEFTIIVRGTENGTVHIRAEGDLASTIAFERTEQPLVGEATFKGSINIPDNIVPGDHGQELIVSLQTAEAGTMNPQVELATILTARRRFEGPYLLVNFYSAPNYGVPNETIFTFTLENHGNTAVTPTAITIEAAEKSSIPPKEIPAGGAAQFSTMLTGQGEYLLTLVVQGDAPLEEQTAIAIGHPIITRFEANLVPDTGNITPIIIDAEVAWNKPVQATLTIAGKSQQLTIDRSLHDTFYTETAAQNITVALTLGPETRQIDLERTAQTTSSTSNKWIIILVLFVILLLVGWYWYRRKKAETFI